MSAMLKLIQDMNNYVISFDRRTVTNATPESSFPPLPKPPSQPLRLNASSSCLGCTFCDDIHDMDPSEVFILMKGHLQRKKHMQTIATLYLTENNNKVIVVSRRYRIFTPKTCQTYPKRQHKCCCSN